MLLLVSRGKTPVYSQIPCIFLIFFCVKLFSFVFWGRFWVVGAVVRHLIPQLL